jgi:hypothetical protein
MDARFGRAAVVVQWMVGSGLSTVVKTALLVGEPDATLMDGGGQPVPHAGRVVLLEAPLTSASSHGGHPNAWATQLVDPSGIQQDAIFGAWIVALNYQGAPPAAGEQFIVSARGKHLFDSMSNPVHQAGQGYSFIPAVP